MTGPRFETDHSLVIEMPPEPTDPRFEVRPGLLTGIMAEAGGDEAIASGMVIQAIRDRLGHTSSAIEGSLTVMQGAVVMGRGEALTDNLIQTAYVRSRPPGEIISEALQDRLQH